MKLPANASSTRCARCKLPPGLMSVPARWAAAVVMRAAATKQKSCRYIWPSQIKMQSPAEAKRMSAKATGLAYHSSQQGKAGRWLLQKPSK